ncbi:Telomeric repeat-binding factor [Trema orientale]|uniref:MYB transcription factor n=1 Tax=Trema orientale TaxID=63057 RepID=A0A2P5FEJ3_TREOI|nr:Telomeric repeat-binding factor [Trema orientale]
MGNQKQKWTPEEEEALLAGVAKYGTGKWKNIIKDPDFAHTLCNRSNIDLKDKWRNLSVSSGSSKEKSRAHKTKSIVASENLIIQNSDIAASIPLNASSCASMNDPSNCTQDGKSASPYKEMIFEALSTMKDVNESDVGAIHNFSEKRHGTPLSPNFKRSLSSRSRKLVVQEKPEKVENGYKIRKEIPMGRNTPSPKQKNIRSQRSLDSRLITCTESQDDVADAAFKVAEAENKSFLAAEAVGEAEQLSRIAEDSECMLQLMNEIYKQCSRGELVHLA